MREPGERIVVVGTTGAGKTTMARRLSDLLGLPHIELDALNWRAGWEMAPREEFRGALNKATQEKRWVVDGNYRSRAQDIVWSRADTLVWLDYALGLILWRLVQRTIRRTVSQEELWHGNRERFAAQFLSRESLLLYAIKTHGQRRKDYNAIGREPKWSHLNVIRLRSAREAERWLTRLGEEYETGG